MMNMCVYIKYMHDMGYNAVKTMIKTMQGK